MTENDMISVAWIKEIAEEMQNQYNKEHGLICEMAKVADLDGYKLVIWPNDEGMIPHFHIIKGRNPNNKGNYQGKQNYNKKSFSKKR